MLPGLTGLWQVNGKNKTNFEQMVQLDIKYVRSHSLGLDLRVLLKTFSAVATQIHEALPHKNRQGADPAV